MKRSVIALISLAVIGLSGAAFAADTANKPAAMSDAQMDAVTAGDPGNGRFRGRRLWSRKCPSAKLPGNNSHPGGNSDFGHNH